MIEVEYTTINKKVINEPLDIINGCHVGKGAPTHTHDLTMLLCLDSRKTGCPYNLHINIDTQYMSLRQSYCLWSYKK